MMLTEKILSLPLPFQQSSLSLSYSFLRQDGYLNKLPLWILWYFSVSASWIIKSWFTTYLLQSDWEVSLQFTWFPFFTADLLWPYQFVWIQTANCFLMLMHSLELTVEDFGVSCFAGPFYNIFCHIEREQDRFEMINTSGNGYLTEVVNKELIDFIRNLLFVIQGKVHTFFWLPLVRLGGWTEKIKTSQPFANWKNVL